QFYPDILTDKLKDELAGKNEKQTWAICQKPFNIVGIKRKTKGKDLLRENYEWRSMAVKQKMNLEELAVVLQKINGQLRNSSGYLGDISDRSKKLYFRKQTVGEYQMEQLSNNPNYSLKNQVFYRQDYMDEFETLWTCQSKFHPELTPELKSQIKDRIIFYQRPLKSQKGLIGLCELESRNIEIEVDGIKKTKTIGPRVCPKSSPLFQEFKIWQVLNNLVVINRNYRNEREDGVSAWREKILDQEAKEMLFEELRWKDKLSKADALKLLFGNAKGLDLNYKEIEGDRTNATLLKAYEKIVEVSGHGEYNFSKMPSSEALKIVENIFSGLGYNTEILHFDSSLEGKAFEEQPAFRLWHLLYSYEGDNSKSGNDKLVEKISALCGFEPEYAKIVASISFAPDYGSLSSKAMKKILPYMKEGNTYSLACEYAGYRHSKRSLTREELDKKVLKDKLDELPKNSLRNPVVEKILNQMINVVNGVIDEYGKPDEIRIELARDLKKSAKEREEMSAAISKSSKERDAIRETISKDFGIAHPSNNDILRYRLYMELKDNGFKSLYSNTYIPYEKLFSKEFDVDHIIPQAKLFDDSFSNKTLEKREVNIDKSNATAMDFVKRKYGEDKIGDYKSRVDVLMKNGSISKTKRRNLLMTEAEIPEGFIERDLRNSQYIARKAREILEELVRDVVPTTGAVTARLREDWQLVDVMQELNWNKYDKQGLTYSYKDKDGRTIRKIEDWTKRNDHRHHAMDALTVAFTKRSFIQYLNNLNARIAKGVDDDFVDLRNYKLNDLPKEERSRVVRFIENSQLYRDVKGRLRFYPPIPLDGFRSEAKKHLESILVSIKAKNKVVTRNVNKTKKRGGHNVKVQLTPRGQLHNETVYGRINRYVTKEERVGGTFDATKIATVANKSYRKALQKRLEMFGNDPKKAFTGKNSLDKNPLYIDDLHTMQVPIKVKTVTFEPTFTIRKPVDPNLNVNKVVDVKVRQ
ncbi:MAG: type II CRISPR RNA-guided endonuclease Cas9, partial [Fermentimonas sp.]